MDEQHGTSEPEPDEEEPADYNLWTVADLKAEIQERNEGRMVDNRMSADGNKADLVRRLEEDDRRQPPA
jgi:hypothetical protein